MLDAISFRSGLLGAIGSVALVALAPTSSPPDDDVVVSEPFPISGPLVDQAIADGFCTTSIAPFREWPHATMTLQRDEASCTWQGWTARLIVERDGAVTIQHPDGRPTLVDQLTPQELATVWTLPGDCRIPEDYQGGYTSTNISVGIVDTAASFSSESPLGRALADIVRDVETRAYDKARNALGSVVVELHDRDVKLAIVDDVLVTSRDGEVHRTELFADQMVDLVQALAFLPEEPASRDDMRGTLIVNGVRHRIAISRFDQRLYRFTGGF